MRKRPISNKGFSAVEAIIVLVIIFFICFAGYFVYRNHHRVTISNSSSQDINTADIISGMEQALSAKFTIKNGTAIPTSSNVINVSTSVGGPAWELPGYNFYAAPSSQGIILSTTLYQPSASAYPPRSAVATVNKIISAELKKLKLVPTISPTIKSETGATYQNTEAVCGYQASSTFPAGITCADKSEYPALFAKIQPLAAAYIVANALTGANSTRQTFQTPKIENSVTSGYKFAYMPVAEAVGYYYQKNGVWHFYTAGEEGLSCDFSDPTVSNANNTDAQIAFQGQPCQSDTGKLSTVTN